MSLDDIFRTINLLLSIAILLWLTIRRFNNSSNYPRGGLRRDIWAMAFLWVLASVIGTAEQLFDTGTYARVVCTLAALLTTLSILLRPREDWPKPNWKELQSR